MLSDSVVVFGSDGMLGRYVSQYLQEQNVKVTRLTRNNLDLTEYYTKSDLTKLIGHVEFPIVINCAGLISQRKDTDVSDMIKLNAVFPQMLAETCSDARVPFIHISTDCVYSGIDPTYKESDEPDATSIYGKSKALGESSLATVIRTSIIGEEKKRKLSLLEWVRSNQGKSCFGYYDHLWNGVTCLQLAKAIMSMICTHETWPDIQHVFSQPTSKYELILMINEVYDLGIKVEPVPSPDGPCLRLLDTENKAFFKIFGVPNLHYQIMEQKDYKLR